MERLAKHYAALYNNDDYHLHGVLTEQSAVFEFETFNVVVQTFSPDAAPDLVVLEKHRFEDLGGGRTRLTAQSLVESFEHRDAFIDAGLLEGYARLDQLLEGL